MKFYISFKLLVEKLNEFVPFPPNNRLSHDAKRFKKHFCITDHCSVKDAIKHYEKKGEDYKEEDDFDVVYNYFYTTIRPAFLNATAKILGCETSKVGFEWNFFQDSCYFTEIEEKHTLFASYVCREGGVCSGGCDGDLDGWQTHDLPTEEQRKRATKRIAFVMKELGLKGIGEIETKLIISSETG